MKLLMKNHFFRYSTLSSFLNQFGSAIYNLVFVLYVARTYQSKELLAIANVVTMLPIVFQVWIGQKADEIVNRASWLIGIGFVQFAFFILVAVLTHQASYLAFSVICLLNICSDCLANLASGISMPIFKEQIHPDDLMEAYSFRSVLSYISAIGGQVFGVWLLEISKNNFTLVALVNALSFLLSSLVLVRIKKYLISRTEPSDEGTFREKLRRMYQASKAVFSTQADQEFFSLIAIMLILNVLGSSLLPIYNLYFLDHNWYGLSYGQMLLLLNIVMIGGNILGGLFSKDYFSRLSLRQLLYVEILIYGILGFLSLLQVSFGFIILVFGVNCYLVGKFNPKFHATLLMNVAENQLAQVSSFISLLVMISIPLGTGLFSLLFSFHAQLL